MLHNILISIIINNIINKFNCFLFFRIIDIFYFFN